MRLEHEESALPHFHIGPANLLDCSDYNWMKMQDHVWENAQVTHHCHLASSSSSSQSSASLMDCRLFLLAHLEAEIYDKWVEGSPGLDLELHEVCTEKKESLVVTDIKAFRAVADLLQCKIPVPKATEEVQLSELAMSKFELLKKQLDYDQTAFRVHQAKVKNYEHAVHHAKLEWKQKLRSEAMQWCTSWLAKKCKIFVYDFFTAVSSRSWPRTMPRL